MECTLYIISNLNMNALIYLSRLCAYARLIGEKPIRRLRMTQKGRKRKTCPSLERRVNDSLSTGDIRMVRAVSRCRLLPPERWSSYAWKTGYAWPGRYNRIAENVSSHTLTGISTRILSILFYVEYIYLGIQTFVSYFWFFVSRFVCGLPTSPDFKNSIYSTKTNRYTLRFPRNILHLRKTFSLPPIFGMCVKKLDLLYIRKYIYLSRVEEISRVFLVERHIPP